MKETLAEVTSRLEKWPDDRWWEQFSNAELNQLMDTALKDNPGLKLASARLREAQGFVRVEGARLLPFLEADASLTYERISQHGVFAALNPEVAGARILLGVINPLSFRYEFDFWGKNRAMLEAALGQAAAEEAEHGRSSPAPDHRHCPRVFPRPCAVTANLILCERSSTCGASFASWPKRVSSSAWIMNLALKQAIADYEAAVKRQAGVRDQLDVQRHLLARLAGKGPDEGLSLFNRTGICPARLSTCAGTPLDGIAGAPSRSGRNAL